MMILIGKRDCKLHSSIILHVNFVSDYLFDIIICSQQSCVHMMNDVVGIDDMSLSTPGEDDVELGSKAPKRKNNFNNEDDKA